MKNFNNCCFDQKALRILLCPERWHVLCTGLSSELPEHSDSAHREWLKTHTDRHAHREVLLTLQGEIISSSNGRMYKLPPATLLLIDKYEKHDRAYPPETHDIEHLWLFLMERQIVARIYRVLQKTPMPTGEEFIVENEFLRNLLNQAFESLRQATLPPLLKRQKMVTAVALVLQNLVEQSFQGPFQRSGTERHAHIIKMIEQHIAATSGKGLDLEQLARIAGYSKFHFLRIFKKQTGKTVLAYINEVRLDKVKSLLQRGYTKAAISAELGFSSPSSFAHWHRKYHPPRKKNTELALFG